MKISTLTTDVILYLYLKIRVHIDISIRSGRNYTLPKFGSVNGRSMNMYYYGTSKLQQYGCQTGNERKEKLRDLNRNSSRNKNETMFGSGYENCPEFGVLGGVIFKLDIL